MTKLDHIDHILLKHSQGPLLENRTSLLVALILLYAGIEAPLLGYSLPFFFTVHLFLSAFLSMLIYYGYKKQWDLRYYTVFIILFVPMGPLGCMVTFSSLVLYGFYFYTKTPLRELLKALYPEEEEDPVEILYERINTGLEDFNPKTRPIPFQDVMAYGTTTQKRSTIEKVLRFYRPEFAGVLTQGIRDKENAIRIMSATAITRLDTQYTTKFQQLQKLVKEQPKNVDVLLDFAKQCEACARAGVLDDDREKKMLGFATKAYEQYCETVPGEVDVILALGRVAYLNGDYMKAVDWLRMVLRTSDRVPMSTFKWLFNAIFRIKEYGYIRKICKRIEGDSSTEYEDLSNLNELVELWSTNSTKGAGDDTV